MNKALVLLSGGMDSVMALLWARGQWSVEAIAVHYGQRHFAELAAAWDITKALDVPFETLEMSAFSSIAPSTLTGRLSRFSVNTGRLDRSRRRAVQSLIGIA